LLNWEFCSLTVLQKKTSNVHAISFLCPCLLFGGCITSTFVIGSKLTCILWWWTFAWKHQIHVSAIWMTFWEVWQNKKKSKDGKKNVLFICQVPVETIGPDYFDYVSLGPVNHVYNVTFHGFYTYCFFTGRFFLSRNYILLSRPSHVQYVS